MKKFDKIYEFLASRQGQRFTAQEVAEHLALQDNVISARKSNYSSNDDFVAQISREVYSTIYKYNDQVGKDGVVRSVFYEPNSKPRAFFVDLTGSLSSPNSPAQHPQAAINPQISSAVVAQPLSSSTSVTTVFKKGFSEHDLYPVLMNWLFEDQNIRCRRIDENRSSNSLGSGGNFWRHPDIVGFEDVSIDWEVDVRECAKNGNFSPIRWFSYEVKKELNLSNTRECFFQTLSNSSWANEGYLVTAGISEKKKGIVTNELRELSDDYGIGVILLDYNEPSKSKVLFQAKRKEEVNWRAIDRVCKENPDFKDYVERVNDYHKTGRIRENDWKK